MKANILLIVVVAMAVYLVPTPTIAISGGWQPIPNINDPHIQELGRWAVTEHDKTKNDGLKFNRVVGGDEQVVAGVRYRLVIEASNPNGKYEAVLTEQVWINARILSSFNPAN